MTFGNVEELEENDGSSEEFGQTGGSEEHNDEEQLEQNDESEVELEENGSNEEELEDNDDSEEELEVIENDEETNYIDCNGGDDTEAYQLDGDLRGNRVKRNVDSSSGQNPNTNPVFGNRVQLVSETNYFLAINPNKTVIGTDDKDDENTHLELITTGEPGYLRIRSIPNRFYLAMNDNGRVYSTENGDEANTIFFEGVKFAFETYLSYAHADKQWYLGINVGGKVKNGKKTVNKRKDARFTKRQLT